MYLKAVSASVFSGQKKTVKACYVNPFLVAFCLSSSLFIHILYIRVYRETTGYRTGPDKIKDNR